MIGKSRQEIAAKARKLAAECERTCTGCARSELAGPLRALGIEAPDVLRATSGLADGIGLTGDRSYGALTAGCACDEPMSTRNGLGRKHPAPWLGPRAGRKS